MISGKNITRMEGKCTEGGRKCHEEQRKEGGRKEGKKYKKKLKLRISAKLIRAFP